MNQPHNVHHLVNAIHADYHRARRKPTAWTEAADNLFRPPWAGFSLRKVWERIRMNRKSASQPVGKEAELQEVSAQA